MGDARAENMRAEYVARINRVLDHIEAHLDEPLPLNELARVACFSPYHFHRIFRGFMGETIGQFIRRVRVERAAMKLVHSPKLSITEIALDCGFSGSEAFARAFREAFGMSASEWRKESNEHHRDSKNRQGLSKIQQASNVTSTYLDPVTGHMKWRVTMNERQSFQVEVKDMPEKHVAYVRHVGPYKGDAQLFAGLMGKLMKWAGPRGFLRFPQTEMLAMYHDDPKVTDEDKLRLSICITIPEDASVDGEVGKTSIPRGKYAVARFELASEEFEEAWQSIYGGWLPESGYQPDDRPALEFYRNNPEEHPEKKCIVDICVPVKPL